MFLVPLYCNACGAANKDDASVCFACDKALGATTPGTTIEKYAEIHTVA